MRFSLFLFVALAACAPAEPPAPVRPNLIYILADDLGYGDLGSYGQSRIRTPRLDSLAARGMRFTDHYAGSTVCAPSRASLLTGLHQGHAPVRGNRAMTLRPQDSTFVQRLQQAGYRTAMIGKWGLGDAGSTGEPSAVGFDEYYGYLDQVRAHNYYPEYLYANGERVALPNDVILAPDTYAKGLGGASTNKAVYSHDLFTERALDFIGRAADEPFFLYLPYTIPHVNNQGYLIDHHGMEVPELGDYAGRDWPDAERAKAAMITRLDRDVGRLVDRLDSLGLAEHTLVLFSSDNGPHREGVDPAFFDSNGPLRGNKRDLYEGGIRVPLIAHWPGRVPAGRVSSHPSANYDIGPTLLDVADLPPLSGADGLSMKATLLGEGEQARHEYLYWEFTEGKNKTRAVRTDDWKYIEDLTTGEVELYKLLVDEGEEDDIHPLWPRRTQKMRAFAEAAHVPHPTYPLPGEE